MGSEVFAVVRQPVVLVGKRTTEVERKAARILCSRIEKRTGISMGVADEDERPQVADIEIVVGALEHGELNSALAQSFGLALPCLSNSGRVHPEGFLVGTGKMGGASYVLVAGADERGTLYAVGHLLRSMVYRDGVLEVPHIRTSDRPAFWMRGSSPTGPGSRARRYGNLRPQTADERREVLEDLMLLGTNIFHGDPDEIRSYGMMTTSGRTANEIHPKPDGSRGFPAEWAADGGTSQKYVCPSIPQAREALLRSFEEMFREQKVYDFFTTNSGDSGGCRCEKCMPWGGAYIRLVHEIADILHRYQPERKVLATNQDLTNEGNQAILDYLNSGDSSWLYAIRYGPGADEMQTYIRGPVNPRWFEYEGFGPLGNYLKHLHHELPRETNIALYTDITHWMQSQFGVPEPDVALAAVYSRRSWNARPRHFVRIGREILHYAVGDMHYSEGMHDDFNKWVWYRLLWNPGMTAEELTHEYCRYWFGPEAEDEMAEAIFLMEETLERPVRGNGGIGRAVELLRSAGTKIPERIKVSDYRWRIIAQKALMDLYIQLLLERGDQLKDRAAKHLRSVASSADPEAEVRAALAVLNEGLVTDEMASIRGEAIELGDESNRVIGYRVPAPFIVEGMDLTEVEWCKEVLLAAVDSGGPDEIRNAVTMVLRYDDPGEGGIYESFGWPSSSHNLLVGDESWGFMPFRGPARLSHFGVAYTFGRGGESVTVKYTGLDPAARYVLRISVGVHVEEGEFPARDFKLAQGLEVNGKTICEEFQIPLRKTALFEFDLPHGVADRGEIIVKLLPRSGLFPVTGLNELWLMREENVPWRVPAARR